MFDAVVGKSTDGKLIISGSEVFKMKDTYGLPWSIAFQIMDENNCICDWVGFIQEARCQKWYDFQTFDQIIEALNDSGAWIAHQNVIIQKIKDYMTYWWNTEGKNYYI